MSCITSCLGRLHSAALTCLLFSSADFLRVSSWNRTVRLLCSKIRAMFSLWLRRAGEFARLMAFARFLPTLGGEANGLLMGEAV